MENTKIEWATHTLNWWTGCEHVSPACDGCYAEAWAKRAGRNFAERRQTSGTIHKLPFKWEREAIATGDRPYVFVNSLSDFFDNKVPDEWRESFFSTARQTPHVTYLLLTKRIGNAARMLPPGGPAEWPNLWLGSTVVTPEEAARDIPKLLRTPAAIHFLSIEPMLAAMNIDRWLWDDDQREGHVTGLDWVIAGGESGGHARPLNPDWIRGLRDQCSEAGVDFFFKQWGEWAPPDAVPPEKWHDRHTYDSGAYMMRVGKDVAGAKLDGCLLRARPPHQTPSIRLAH